MGFSHIQNNSGNVNQTLLSRHFREGVFSDGSDGKESACSAGDLDLIHGSGRSPGKGNDYPLQYSCLENPRGREPGGLLSMGLHRVGHD